jgi:hypothetical protein
MRISCVKYPLSGTYCTWILEQRTFNTHFLYNSFGGVGAIIAYSDTMEKETVDVASSSEVLSTEVGLKAEAKVIFGGVGFTLAAEIGYVGEFETSRSTEKSQVKARSRSFALGDADDGDFFDVQVCRDLYR